MKKILLLMLVLTYLLASDYYYMNNGKRVELREISPGVLNKRDMDGPVYFEDGNGKKVGVTRRILVSFYSLDNFEKYLKKYNLKKVKRYNFENLFLLEAGSVKEALSAANSLYEEPDVKFAHPDMVKEWRLR